MEISEKVLEAVSAWAAEDGLSVSDELEAIIRREAERRPRTIRVIYAELDSAESRSIDAPRGYVWRAPSAG